MTTLMDTVRIEAETRPRVGPGSPLDRSWDNDSESRSRERSFEVASRGGYARTVVGRLAYFDEEAQTYMVLTRSGALVRVPLRDITSSRSSEEEFDRRRRPIEDVGASERDNGFAHVARRLAMRRPRVRHKEHRRCDGVSGM